MDARSPALLLVLAVAGMGLAGCIEAPGFLNTSDVEVSAMEHHRLAEEAALAWSPDARLIGVLGFELTQSDEADVEADPDVGNGLAPAWWYAYALDAGDATEVRAWKVTAEGNVTSEKDAEAMAAGFDHEMAQPLSSWKIDSRDALAAAKENESFRVAAEGFNASVVEGVAHHEGATAWFFAAMSADGFVVATVDAATGELLSVEAFDFDFQMPEMGAMPPAPSQWGSEPIHLEGEGTLDGDEADEYAFSTSGAYHGVLEIQMAQELPSGNLRWMILDAAGDPVADGYLGSWMGADAAEFEVALERADDYTLVVDYGGWVPMAHLSGAHYAFTLHLVPGEAEHEERAR